MKVLYYLLDGETNASSRLRALQYFPLLREHGIQPSASRPVPQWLYQRLVENSRFEMREKRIFYSTYLAARLLDVLRGASFDAVVIQRDLFPFGPPVLERLLRRVNPALVFDTDDPVYIRPSFTPDTVFQKFRRFDKVAEVVRHSRWVSVATEPIAAWARQFNPRVEVIPMALDLAEYDAASKRNRHTHGSSDEPLLIGWTGTAGSVQYLNDLAPALYTLSKRIPIRVRVITGAARLVRLPGVDVELRPWKASRVLRELAACDVGLTPLADLPFEREKFPSKALQYMALSVPTVSSRVGTIQEIVRDGENGLLASTREEWVDALERLALDGALRRRLGAAGYQTVSEQFTTQRVAPRIAAGLRRAADGA